MESEFLEIWRQVSPYTMTSVERGYALYQAVFSVLDRNIAGDFVECGVWKGGSAALMALSLFRARHSNQEIRSSAARERRIWCYDTFSGMTEPGEEDRIAATGQSAAKRLQKDASFSSWAVGMEEVKNNLSRVGLDSRGFRFIPGPVEQTLDQQMPDRVALLRLDTDWYESTRVELERLYPLLSPGGVLIIDDYGHFTGARKAVDEYFSSRADSMPVLLQRIDYTGRLVLKPG
ncbi:MAG: TylF/MycF family methyltransferase [Spirochaetales bacterium]|nr:TylF/MycF family methyltransferase [Spirochaetales bacterium]MCF7937087.1 TylF/MycF family methyltransferase [Spirochaetales bacterium]